MPHSVRNNRRITRCLIKFLVQAKLAVFNLMSKLYISAIDSSRFTSQNNNNRNDSSTFKKRVLPSETRYLDYVKEEATLKCLTIRFIYITFICCFHISHDLRRHADTHFTLTFSFYFLKDYLNFFFKTFSGT
jgi:hypothetical protein